MAAPGAVRSVNGLRLYVEELGSGVPILCIHGTGSSALLWHDALPALAEYGRVIAYDRRGCGRSERPEPYERTSPAEHADDAAALLEALAAGPAVVIGRSSGGDIAVDLAIRHPETVRALALLEGAPASLAPAAAAWERTLVAEVIDAAASAGVGTVGATLIEGVFGPGAWATFPPELQRVFTDNGPAILAELRGGGLQVDATAIALIEAPVLVAAADASHPVFAAAADALAAALPNARRVQVGGDHLVDPAGPEVLDFLRAVLR